MMHFFFVVSKRDSAKGVRILEGVVVGGEVLTFGTAILREQMRM